MYTSADSVFQVAAHEDPSIFGLSRLYEACEIARELFSSPPNHIGRVIARPFVGESVETFRRTENRRDWPLLPPAPTTLDTLSEAGVPTHFIGKTCELFPELPDETRMLTTSNPAHCAALTGAAKSFESGFVFANLEDFDMLYGHRNDPVGFGKLLEEFDTWLGSGVSALSSGPATASGSRRITATTRRRRPPTTAASMPPCSSSGRRFVSHGILETSLVSIGGARKL